jgi:general secretion pathway protein F
MTVFRYRAVTDANEVVEGEMDAPAREVVVERLRSLGHTPLYASEMQAGSGPASSGRGLFSFKRTSSRDVFLITHELATLLKAGVPLDRAFQTLIDLGENETTKRLLSSILARLRSGVSLADALSEHRDVFPHHYTSMVRAGEASGALEVVLGRLSEFLEKSQALRESIKTALYYPIFLLIMAALSIIILLTFVIPQFEPLFQSAGAALPMSTEVLLAASEFIRSYGWVMIVLLAVAIYLLRRYLATKHGRTRTDEFLLKVPMIGVLVTKIEVARFCRTVSTLLQNGVGLLSALEIVRDTVNNSVISSAVENVALRLKEGRGLADPLAATGVFPKLAVHLVRVGEETGKLDDMLSKLADIYDQDVASATERMLALLVPVLTVGMGVMVAGIIMSILTAIFSVNTLAF